MIHKPKKSVDSLAIHKSGGGSQSAMIAYPNLCLSDAGDRICSLPTNR